MSTNFPGSSIVSITDSLGQGSGVLISPDEVLTAAHVVYDQFAGLATNVQVSPGAAANGTAPFGTVAGTGIRTEPVLTFGDTIALSQSAEDFAVIHLAQPVAEAGTMTLGADYPGGPVSVSGYPYLAGGDQITVSEFVSKDPSYALLTGTPILGQATDAAGSSGGPVWVAANGVATVVGLVSSSETTASGDIGHFLQLTGQDVSTIGSWVAADDAGQSFGQPSGYLLNEVDPITAALRGHAAAVQAFQPHLAARENEGANALDDALYSSHPGTTLDGLFRLAETDARLGAPHPALDVGFLAGFIFGHDGGDPGSVADTVASQFPKLFASHPQAAAAAAQSGYDLSRGTPTASIAPLGHGSGSSIVLDHAAAPQGFV